MTYQPVDIVAKLRDWPNDPAFDLVEVEAWRDALAAELERLANNVAPAVPEGFVDVRIAYRHAARLVRGEP